MIQLYGLNSVVNWLFVMMALAKGIIGMIAMKNAFIFQVAFSGLVRVSNSRGCSLAPFGYLATPVYNPKSGLLHLATLPLLDNFEFIQKSKQLLRKVLQLTHHFNFTFGTSLVPGVINVF